MTNYYSIGAPNNPNFDSPITPGFYNNSYYPAQFGNQPPATNSSPNVILGGHATEAAALTAFVDNCTSILDGSLHPVVRVSYPVLAEAFLSSPTGSWPVSLYVPDYTGYYAQFNYSVTYSIYYYTVYTTDNPAGYELQTLVIYNAPEETSPAPPPSEVTIQLKRDGGITGTYSVKPSDAAHLPKYYAPVKYIRAKFATTRVAVIEDTLDGGFMIYEEVAGEPSGSAYIYSGERKLVEVIDAANVPQYRARYVP